jgi:hypothetical protein
MAASVSDWNGLTSLPKLLCGGVAGTGSAWERMWSNAVTTASSAVAFAASCAMAKLSDSGVVAHAAAVDAPPCHAPAAIPCAEAIWLARSENRPASAFAASFALTRVSVPCPVVMRT